MADSPDHDAYADLARKQQDRLKKLNARLAAGQIDSEEWADSFHAILFDGHTQAWVLGRQRAGDGSPRSREDEHFGLGAADAQNEFLRGFKEAIDAKDPRYVDEQGNVRTSALDGRSTQYVARMRGTANEAFVAAGEPDDEYDWVLGPTEHCPDCADLAALSPYTASTMISHPGDGQTECRANCACSLVRRRGELSGFERPDIYADVDQGSRKLFEGDVQISSAVDARTLEETTKAIFGRPVSEEELAQLAAAPGGSTVAIDADDQAVRVKVEQERLQIQMDRVYQLDADGKLYAFHEFTEAKKAPKLTGLRLFARQVKQYASLGFDRIENVAEGHPGDPKFNGYYTWPRFGYNMTLDVHTQRRLEKEGYEGVKDLHGLFLFGDEAAQWWKDNGYGGDMVFDLSDGSMSMDMLRGYMSLKKVKV